MFNIRIPLHEEMFAIVDLSPGAARAALVSAHRGGVHVHAQTYSLIKIEAETPEHSIAAIGERIDDVTKRLMERAAQLKLKNRIGKVYCVVHAPWTKSVTERKRVVFETETKIHESHIADLAKDILSEIKEIDMNNMMEAAVIRTWLNGYPVVKPEGKLAQALVVCAIVSELDQNVKKNAESAIQRAFPAASIEWRSAARAMQTVLGAAYRDDENYLAVDMGLDGTHIISVRDAMPTGDKVAELGLRTILTRIDPNRVAEETLGLIRMVLRDACEGSACDAIQKAMASAEPEFVKKFGESFSALAADRRLANTLVLSCNPDIVEWMKQFFSRLDFTQFTATTLPFTVLTPEAGIIPPEVTSDEALRPQLAFAAALVNMEMRD